MSKKRSILLGVGKSSIVGARAAWPLLLAAVVAASGLLLLSWWNQERIEDQMRTDTENALTTVRDATTGSIQQWFREREEEARVWAGHGDVRDDVRVLAGTE